MQVCTGGFFSNFIEKEKQLVSRYDMYYSNIEKNCRDRILSGTVWQMGSYGGRLGCSAILHPIQSSFTTSNTSIKVIANSNIDYDIWIHVSSFYCKTNYVVEGSSGLKVTPKWTISTEAPTGTECNLSYTN